MRKLPLFFLSLFLCAAALAEDPLCPTLTDPVDQRVQQLAIQSQQDARFDGVRYNNGDLSARGCEPFSIANGIIAAFGVTDSDTAAGIVLETTKLLASGHKPETAVIEMTALPAVLDPAQRLQEQGVCPALAASIGAFGGSVVSRVSTLSADKALALAADAGLPAVICGRMYVNNGWEEVARLLIALHEQGLDEAMLCLTHAGAGVDSSRAPLRSGQYGHYLGVLIHVGAFMDRGAVYVLDSLPRALAGEPCGPEFVCHSRYAFLDDDPENSFNLRYTASRIRPTVIRLSLTDGELQRIAQLRNSPKDTPSAQREAEIDLRTRQLRPLMLYGSCVMLLSLPAAP